jgi:hypothetical protein
MKWIDVGENISLPDGPVSVVSSAQLWWWFGCGLGFLWWEQGWVREFRSQVCSSPVRSLSCCPCRGFGLCRCLRLLRLGFKLVGLLVEKLGFAIWSRNLCPQQRRTCASCRPLDPQTAVGAQNTAPISILGMLFVLRLSDPYEPGCAAVLIFRASSARRLSGLLSLIQPGALAF